MRWLALAAMLVLLSVVEQGQPAPTQHKVENQETKAGERKAVPRHQPSTPGASGTTQKQPATEPPPKPTPSKWVPGSFGDVLDILTLIVTTWFLIYTYKTWKEMVRANDHTEKSNAENDRHTEESLALTRAQLALAEQSAHVGRQDTGRAIAVAETQAAALARVGEATAYGAEAGVRSLDLAQKSLVLTRESNDATLRAVEIAERHAEAAARSAEMARLMERPWVTVSVAALDVFKINNNGSGVLLFSLVLENVGRSAATDIRYEVDLFPIGDEAYRDRRFSDSVVRRQETISARLAESAPAPGFALFPGEVGPVPVVREVNGDRVLECVTRAPAEWYVVLCLAGVVVYRFATSDTEHTTKFAFYVGEHEPGKARAVIRLGQTMHLV